MIAAKNIITGKISSKSEINGSINSKSSYMIPDNVITNELVEALPEASEEYRGHFRMIEVDGTDTLYVCLKVNGVFTWAEFSKGYDADSTNSNLDKAILNALILR